ncbi:MAG TPA: c-type cytochrome [Gemmataceae bacterium]|jgi:mono/diheme cytochrome c family protein|nr:c-type cytochrome [Gemmataceae bacterium]
MARPGFIAAFALCLVHQSARVSLQAGDATTALSTAQISEERIGLTLYRQNCQRCHDQNGKGTRSKALMPEIPDFTSKPWQNQRSDVDLVVSIMEGKGSHMPAFSERFAREGLQELIAHVRSYAPRAGRTATRLDSDFERRFRALQEEMADLRRQYDVLSEEAMR